MTIRSTAFVVFLAAFAAAVVSASLVGPEPRQDISKLDQGCPGKTRGWYDAQCKGSANDYCRYVGSACDRWSCALAGSKEQHSAVGAFKESTTSKAPCGGRNLEHADATDQDSAAYGYSNNTTASVSASNNASGNSSEYNDYGYYGDYGYHYGSHNATDNSSGYYDYGGDGDYYGDYEDNTKLPACRIDHSTDDLILLNITKCDVQLEGFDRHGALLPGGLDGVYKLTDCFDGKPRYRRQGPVGEELVLLYSAVFGDWQIRRLLTSDTDDGIVAYGVQQDDRTPLNVTKWCLWSAKPGRTGADADACTSDYAIVTVSIKCADDGAVLKSPPKKNGTAGVPAAAKQQVSGLQGGSK